MKSLLLRRARVVDPANDLDAVRDVLLEGSRIAKVGARLSRDAKREIDLDGMVLTPGLIDPHVHLREPGQEYKETIASGTAAAAAGGFTAVACMANTDPVNDSRAVTELILAEAKRFGSVRVYPVGALSVGLEGKKLAPIAELVEAGCVAISDDGRPVMDGSLMRKALEYCRKFDVTIMAHEQDELLVGDGVMNEGAVSARLGLPGWPAHGEESMIARDVLLAEDTGGKVHMQHVTTGRGLAIIRDAKKRGAPVTCEVCPHHLTLTDDACLNFDTEFKMNPPLRTAADCSALIRGLRDAFDAIASDHAPHHPDEKARDFIGAPFGTMGLETTVPVVLTELVNPGRLEWSQFVKLCSLGPAQILGVEGGSLGAGSVADITVIDPEREREIDPESFRSKSRNTVFKGWQTRGAAVMTIVGGRVVFDDR